jgi:hypothetical protein
VTGTKFKFDCRSCLALGGGGRSGDCRTSVPSLGTAIATLLCPFPGGTSSTPAFRLTPRKVFSSVLALIGVNGSLFLTLAWTTTMTLIVRPFGA